MTLPPRLRSFTMAITMLAASKPKNVHSSGADHLSSVADHMRIICRPYLTPSHATNAYRRLRATPKISRKRSHGTPSAPEASRNGDSGIGGGSTAVTEAGYGQAVIYDFAAGSGRGNDVISGFQTGTDQLVFQGVTVAGQTASGGSTMLVLSDGTHVTLVGVGSVGALAAHVH